MEYFDFLNTEYIFVLNNLANGGAQENIQGPPISGQYISIPCHSRTRTKHADWVTLET